MTRHATTTGADRLVHCSPDRTVFATSDSATGRKLVCKLFVRGSLAEAERELTFARSASGLDVASYRDAAIDPATGRPRLLIDWVDGLDLAQCVAREGAIPASRAAELMLPVARTLAALHAQRSELAPHGICHGDVKPANLMATATTTLLLDFEHARAISDSPYGAHEQITGTPGFAAPEAAAGALPQPSIDVFGLGATLRWLLTGGGVTELPQDAELLELVQACTADEPQRRPTAAAIADRLAGLTQRLADDPEEELLARLTSGERLDFVSDAPRFLALRRLARRQRRLHDRLPGLWSIPAAVPTTPGQLRTALHGVQRALRWSPRHTDALRWRESLAAAAREMIASVAEMIREHERAEQFDVAARWLDDAISLADTLQHLPGGAPIPGAPDPRAVSMLQRDPTAFLHRLHEQVDLARSELDAATADIDATEERLDLAAAEAAIDAMARRYGGSSPTAARRRDQLHRLAFYLDRIACAQPNVERIAQIWDKNALDPLLQFTAECARTSYRPANADLSSEPLGLRSLQVALINLAEEFPHLYVRSGPALDALSAALHHTSDFAWELVAEARQQLAAVPVPVRPLQITFGRLDTFRILEALVDRPERPRSKLLDGIESMRLKFEQARAARDRLAQGAEQAMARGHWTTGLFDMERAVAGLTPTDEAERAEAVRLEARLAEARSRKSAIDRAVRRNVELGSTYGLLQDDGSSSFAQRLQVLTERRDCLQFLAVNLPSERATLYTRDLHEVDLQITLEQSGLAQTDFDATEALGERLRIARQTLERLEASAGSSDPAAETPGRLLRLLEHWRTAVQHCQRDEERQKAEVERQRRSRSRMVLASAFLLVVTMTAVGWALRPWLFGAAVAASTTAPSWSELDHEMQLLPASTHAAARALIAAGRPPYGEAWSDNFATAMLAFAAVRAGDDDAPMRAFAQRCWHTAMTHALADADADGRERLRTEARALVGNAAMRGIEPPPILR